MQQDITLQRLMEAVKWEIDNGKARGISSKNLGANTDDFKMSNMSIDCSDFDKEVTLYNGDKIVMQSTFKDFDPESFCKAAEKIASENVKAVQMPRM